MFETRIALALQGPFVSLGNNFELRLILSSAQAANSRCAGRGRVLERSRMALRRRASCSSPPTFSRPAAARPKPTSRSQEARLSSARRTSNVYLRCASRRRGGLATGRSLVSPGGGRDRIVHSAISRRPRVKSSRTRSGSKLDLCDEREVYRVHDLERRPRTRQRGRLPG